MIKEMENGKKSTKWTMKCKWKIINESQMNNQKQNENGKIKYKMTI